MQNVNNTTNDEIDTNDIPPLTEDFFERANVRVPNLEVFDVTQKSRDAYMAAKNRHLAQLDTPTDLGTNGQITVSRDELHDR